MGVAELPTTRVMGLGDEKLSDCRTGLVGWGAVILKASLPLVDPIAATRCPVPGATAVRVPAGLAVAKDAASLEKTAAAEVQEVVLESE